MSKVLIQEAASFRLDEIYCYTRATWGEAQADRYITGLFDVFQKIEAGQVLSRPIPAKFSVSGFCFRYEKHFVYWRRLSNRDIGIVTLLHQAMHQIQRFKDDLESEA